MGSYKEKYSDIQECLQDILNENGKVFFKNGSQVVSLLRDLMPSDKSGVKMIRRMVENDILSNFVAADSQGQAEKDRAIFFAVQTLVNEESIEEVKARQYVTMLAKVFGWKVSIQKKEKPVQPPKDKPPQPKKTGKTEAPAPKAEYQPISTASKPGLLRDDNPYGQNMGHFDFEKYPVFRSRFLRREIVSVTFLNSLKAKPYDAWDVSHGQDRTVMAWVKPAGGLYDLFIAAEGGVDGRYACKCLFKGYDHLKTVRFNGNFYTGMATSMANMFRDCRALTDLDLSGFDTSNVTDMNWMFARCESLKTLNISSFNTSKVENMESMFWHCKSLETVDVSRFDTGRVTNMYMMFKSCESLKNLNPSGWNTSNTTNMSKMFQYCQKLIQLDLSRWDTSNVTDMSYMLNYTGGYIMLGQFDTRNVQKYESFMADGALYQGRPWEELFRGKTDLRSNPPSSQGGGNQPVQQEKTFWQKLNGFINLLKKLWYLPYAVFVVGGVTIAPFTNPDYSITHVLILALLAAAIWLGYSGKNAASKLVQTISRWIRRLGAFFSCTIIVTGIPVTGLQHLAYMEDGTEWLAILLGLWTLFGSLITLGVTMSEDI